MTMNMHSQFRASFGRMLAFVLCLCVLAGLVTARFSSQALADGAELSPADLYEQNVNSTVGITISAQTTSRYGYGYTYQAAGSGFIISDDGYILTNYHVIENSDTVTVATYDNKTYDAKVIGYDESNDIAVIKVEAEGLEPVNFGDSDTLRVGDPVYAIGNPLGELTFSMTGGMVSALSRDIRTSSNTMTGLIQTDCAINSGNSGGALFNARGEVVGITNAKYSASGYSEAEIDNIGFAIPINNVYKIVMSIIDNGYILKPYIGVSITSLSEETSKITGIKAGAWISEVVEGEAADKAGLKVNDVIVGVDDGEIASSTDLVKCIGDSAPGDTLTFHIYRQGQEMDVEVEVGSKQESATKNEDAKAEQEAQQPAQQPYQQNPYGQYPSPWGSDPMEDFFRYFFG